jgi:hypothetical protein
VTLPFQDNEDRLRLVAEVKRCEPIGQFYLVGCEFVSFA